MCDVSSSRSSGVWRLGAAAAFFEEGAEEGGGFGLEDAAFCGECVVEAFVGGDVVEGTGGAGFGIRRRVDEAAYAGGVEGPGAHGAGLEGGVEGTTAQAPAPQPLGGASEGEELGVGGRVPGRLALVVGRGEDFVAPRDDGADGHLAPAGGLFGLFEGVAHEAQVAGGVRLAGFFRRVAGGFVRGFAFKFFGHEADNSSTTRVGVTGKVGSFDERFLFLGTEGSCCSVWVGWRVS